jgi:hypothetical protein
MTGNTALLKSKALGTPIRIWAISQQYDVTVEEGPLGWPALVSSGKAVVTLKGRPSSLRALAERGCLQELAEYELTMPNGTVSRFEGIVSSIEPMPDDRRGIVLTLVTRTREINLMNLAEPHPPEQSVA